MGPGGIRSGAAAAAPLVLADGSESSASFPARQPPPGGAPRGRARLQNAEQFSQNGAASPC